MILTLPFTKKIFLIALLVFCSSCSSQPEKEVKFDTQTMNVKGNIKHITEKTGDMTWDYEFQDNKLKFVNSHFFGSSRSMKYELEYDQGKLVKIYSGSSEVSAEIFSTNFELRLPLYGFDNVQKMVRNKYGDVVGVFYKKNETPNEYTLKYTYDKFNNWISRELYMQPGNFLKERTERTILYDRKIEQKEISAWNFRLDSVFTTAKRRNDFIAESVNNSIEKDYPKLKQINSYLNTNIAAVEKTETYTKQLIIDFDTDYGKENLTKELKLLREKLVLLESITLKEKFLWSELQAIIPQLISGEKSVKELQEPFKDRTLLAPALDRINVIHLWEQQYKNQ